MKKVLMLVCAMVMFNGCITIGWGAEKKQTDMQEYRNKNVKLKQQEESLQEALKNIQLRIYGNNMVIEFLKGKQDEKDK